MTYHVLPEGGRKRAGRSEPFYLGTVEADDDERTERIAEERWPGLRLRVLRHSDDNVPRTPTSK